MNIKNTIIAIVMASNTLLTTNCGSTNIDGGKTSAAEPTHLVLVYGNHANAITPDLSAVNEKFIEVGMSYGSVAVVEDDGDPYIAVRETASKPNANISAINKKRKAKRFAAKVKEQTLSNATPKTPEVDTLRAVQLGIRELSAKSGRKLLVVLDSCVSTTGALDLTTNYLENINVEETIAILNESQEIPNSEGIEISTYGVGDTASPQDEIGNIARANLLSLWSGIYTAGGCSDLTCDSTLFLSDGSESSAEMPEVSTIVVKQTIKGAKYDDAESSSEPISFSKNDIVEIPEKQIAFIPDTAQFQDTAASKAALQPLAEALKTSNTTCVLIGMTASVGNPESAKTLSRQRAEAVASVLRELGVPDGNLQCIGTGYDSTPFHVQDTDGAGNLDESLAARNRCVLAVSVENKIAANLVKKYS